ncbi:hypothetical protein [Amycolatopsis benzoatilytica]|uniref:hypothetical protein n=1 Tax=Amycolatopsis benzoatilytica TaxID=346045 RepID=UPI0012B68482|nr:hypothetical protein [Amycolatopsis benzoatilytica]
MPRTSPSATQTSEPEELSSGASGVVRAPVTSSCSGGPQTTPAEHPAGFRRDR